MLELLSDIILYVLQTKLMNSVIKVYCKHTEPNFSLPWQRKRQVSSSSSGFLVSQGREKWVLTNAHSVAYYSQVCCKPLFETCPSRRSFISQYTTTDPVITSSYRIYFCVTEALRILVKSEEKEPDQCKTPSSHMFCLQGSSEKKR